MKKTVRIAPLFTNPTDKNLVCDYLSGLGYLIAEPSFQESIELDLFILDIASARSFGRQILDLKKRSDIFLPAIVVLGSADKADAWLEAGFDAVLRAPFTKAELKAQIDILLQLRNQAVELKHKADEKYHRLFESSNDGIAYYDTKGQLILINKIGAANLGGEPPDFIGKKLWEFLDDKMADLVKERIDLVVQTGTAKVFEDHLDLPPGKMYLQSGFNPVYEADRIRGVQIISRDITESRLLSEKLKESESKLRNIISNAVEGFSVTDENGKIIIWNRAMEIITGLKASEILDKYIWDVQLLLLPPEYRTKEYSENLKKQIKKYLRTGKSDYNGKTLEREYTKPDGNTVFVNGTVTSVKTDKGIILVSISSDITEQKKAETDLKESESKLKEAQELAKIGDFTWNVVTGEVTWSDNMYKLLKYDKDEKIDLSKVNAAIHHPEDLEKVTKWLNDCIASGKHKLIPNEYRVVCRDGEVREFHTEGNITYENGKAVRVFGMCQDITERKHAEDRIKESEEKYRLLFQNLPVSFTVIELLKNSGNTFYDFLYSEINPKFAETVGFSVEQLIGSKGSDRMDQSFVQFWLNACSEVLQKKQPVTLEYHSERLDKYFNTIVYQLTQARFAILFDDITERKMAEKIIQESEAKYRKIFSENPNIMILADFRKQILVDVNEAYIRKLGFTREEVLHQKGKLGIAVSDKKNLNYAFEQIKKADRFAGIEITTLSKTGNKLELLVFAEPLDTSEGHLHVLTAIDISERKQKEIALKQSEERFEKFLQAASEGIGIAIEGIIQDVNDRFCEITAYPGEELIGQPITKIVYPEDIEEVMSNVKSGSSQPIEFRILRKDGSIKFVEASGVNSAYKGKKARIAAFYDLTERKQAEAKIRESEANLVALINNTDDSIWSLDRDYNYIVFNEPYADIFYNSYGVKLKKGMNAKHFLKPDELAFWEEKFDAALTGKKVVFEFAHDFGDTIRHYQTSINPIYESNEIVGGTLMSVDITTVKHAEQELNLSNERYKNLFDNSPVPLWEEDFSALNAYLQKLKKSKITDFRNYFDQHPEEVEKCAGLVKIVDLNLAALNLHQTQSKEQLLVNLNKTFTKNSLTVFKEELIALTEGKTAFESQAEVKTLGGEPRYIRLKLKIDTSQPNKSRALISTENITEKYLREKELDKLRYRLEDTMNSISDGVVMFDKNMNYTYVNPKGAELLGTTAEHLIGNNYFELYPEAKESIFAKNYLWVQKHRKPLQFENHYAPWNQWYENRIFPTEEGIAIYFSDITDAKLKKEEIRKSEYNFRTIFEESSDGIMLLDKDSMPLEVNNKVCEMTGYSKEELLKINAMEHLHPDDFKNKDHDAALKKLLAGETVFSNYRFRRKDGTFIFTELTTTLLDGDRFLNIIRDITKRKNAEEARQKITNELMVLNSFGMKLKSSLLVDDVIDFSLDELEKIIKADVIQFYSIDGENLKLRGIKRSDEKYTFGDIPTHKLGDCLCGLTAANKKTIFSENIFRDPRCTRDECKMIGMKSFVSLPIITTDGIFGLIAIGSASVENYKLQEKFLETVISQISISIENALLYEKINNYSSNLEQIVSERTMKLEEANKELEAFSYSVSHDLRAPLRGMHGFTQILMEDYAPKLDEEGIRVCTVIMDNAHKMGLLIDDLLSFSRISRSSITKRDVDMKSLAESVYHEIVSEEDQQKIDFRLTDLPNIKCDPALMKHVWINLISNAVKYSSKNNKPIIKISTFVEDDSVVYCIEDNGVGFNPEYIDKLFGVFQRLHTSAEFKGTGVGLAIVQRILKRHEGKVWAESALNKGAKFYFSLPK